jgi:hypothetical protein
MHLLLHAVLDFFFQFQHFAVVMRQLLLPERVLPERDMNTRHRLLLLYTIILDTGCGGTDDGSRGKKQTATYDSSCSSVL